MTLLISNNEPALELLEAMGIDIKNLVECSIHFKVNEIVHATCVYHCDVSESKLGYLAKTYRFEAIEKMKIGGEIKHGD